MKFHTLVETVFRGFGNNQITAPQCVAERDGCRLPADHSDSPGFLRLILVVGLLGYSIYPWPEILQLDFTVFPGGNVLVHAIPGNVETDALNLAVFRVFDDFHIPGCRLYLKVCRHRVAFTFCSGYHILVLVFLARNRPDE